MNEDTIILFSCRITDHHDILCHFMFIQEKIQEIIIILLGNFLGFQKHSQDNVNCIKLFKNQSSFLASLVCQHLPYNERNAFLWTWQEQ